MRGKAIVKMVFALATALVLTGVLCFLLRLHADGKLQDSLNLNFISIQGFNDRDYNVGGGEFENIDALEINWVGGAVEISTYDGNTLKISEPTMADPDDQLRWRLDEDGKLVIQTCKPVLFTSGKDMLNKTLTVLVPADHPLATFAIDGATADIRMTDLTVTEVEIDLAAGDLTLNNCTVTELSIEGADGNVTASDTAIQTLDMDVANGTVYVDGTVNSAEIDAATVKLTLVTDAVPHKITMDMAAGSADITLPKDAQFIAECSKIAGGMQIKGFETVLRNGSYVCGNGTAQYEFDCAAGEIILRAAS